MHVQVVVQVLGDKIVHEGADGGTAVYGRSTVGAFHLFLPHVGGTQLGLGLALEDGLLDLNGDGAYNALADVLGLVVLLVKVFECLGDGLAVGGQVRAAVPGVLAVDERGDVLTVAVAVGEYNLDVLSLQVDEGIERGFAHVLRHEVQQAVFALVGYSVEVEGEALLEVGVVFDHGLHKFHVEGETVEHLFVGDEADERSVLLVGGDDGRFQEVAPRKACVGALAVAVGGYVEFHRHGIHGLGTHAVHTHALLEVGVVELAARVELGRGVHHFIKRNAAAIVPHRHRLVLDGDVDALAEAHGELVDGVVDDFLQEHIDAVSLTVTVAQPADIHTGAPAYMFVPFQGLDGIIVIAVVYNLCHS